MLLLVLQPCALSLQFGLGESLFAQAGLLLAFGFLLDREPFEEVRGELELLDANLVVGQEMRILIVLPSRSMVLAALSRRSIEVASL